MEFIQAFKRPFSDWKKFLIGVVVFSMVDFFVYIHTYLIGIGFLIILVGYGYVYQSGLFILKKDMSLPDWKDVGWLFRKGLLLIGVFLLYMLPGLLVYWLAGSASRFLQETPTLLPIDIAGLVLSVVGLYLFPFAIFNFMSKQELPAFIEFRVIIKKALSKAYLFAFILALVYGIVIQGIAANINSYITLWVLKAVIWGASAFIIVLTEISLFAIAWNKVKGI